jgi:stage II sporulation protein E
MITERAKHKRFKPNNKLVKQGLECSAFFLLGFVLSLGTVIENMRPFGISLVSVSKRKHFLFSTLGAILGYLIGGINAYSARYLAATVMVSLGTLIATSFDLNYRPAFAMAISFLSDLATGIVLCAKLQSISNEYILVIGEAILAAGGAFFFYKSIYANYRRLRFRALPVSDITCIIISLSIILMNLSKLNISLVYPARIIAILITLTALKFGGDRWAIILSLCFGFALSINDSNSLFLIGALAFSTMVGGLFTSMSSIGIGMSYFCSMGFFAVAAQSEISLSLLTDCLIACIIFVLLPTKLCDKIEQIWDNGKDIAPDGSLRQNLVLKLRFASSAMAAISESVDQVREKINDITRKENEENRLQISEEEYITREIILEKTNQIRMVASDQFFSIAGMLEDLAFEFDEAEIFDSNASSKIRRLLGEHEIYPDNISVIEDKYSRIRVEILTDSTAEGLDNPKLSTEIGKICSRYFEKGRITNFKNQTMLSFSERPNYKLSIGFAQHSAEGSLCGDTVKILNDSKGHSILIISDGMGTGSRAALDGAMGAGLLSRLINAGFGFDSALKVVNSALLVKSNDESLATLDIANIDLFTGKCEIFKAGAPASFIIKDSVVTKCELTSMPAGILRGIEFAKRTAVLRLDDMIVLMSDGITDLGDEWVNNILLALCELGAQEGADYILQEALEQCTSNKQDDMSVICARLERN